MNEKLRILHLEDDRMHASLAQAMLAEEGIACAIERVETEADFVTGLEGGDIDLVLADFTLPRFDGMKALATVRERFPDLPFIFLTGTMGEEPAIESLKSGATDYVLKNRLGRLVPAVRRALAEAGERKERRRAEEALQAERNRFEMVMENIGAGLVLVSHDYRILWANGELTQTFGAIEGRSCFETFHRRTDVCPGCGVREVFEEGSERVVCEKEAIGPGGEPIRVELTVTPVRDGEGNVTSALELAIPISGRKRAEEALRRSNELFRSLFTASPLAVFALDPDGTVRLWNKAAERIFGWSAREVVGSFLPYVPDGQQEEFRLTRERVMAGETLSGLELQRRRKDGSPVTISLYAAPIYDSRGKVAGIMGIAADITEHKQVERDLVQSEQRFRAAFEDAAIGMSLTGLDGRFLAVNRSLCTMLGYSREELMAMSPLAVTHPGDIERSTRWTAGMLANEAGPTHLERRYIRRDGKTVWAIVSKFLLRDSGGTPLYFISQMQDVTEQKNLENQLRHAQKMEAIGTLTGGIAHDFNNLLTAIIGYGCLMEMKMAQDDPMRSFVEQILAAGDRAAALTQSLLAFGRKQAIEPSLVDLNSVVRGVEKLLLRLLREDIDLRTHVSDEVYPVLADTGQIEQVLMNLATNARDAMPRGGLLAISTSVTELDREFITTHGYGEPGEYVMVAVSDSGTGMDEDTIQRIFEPFFTTKEVGKGTGLGLAVAYGIVKQHHGYITCYSEPGNGTTFRIYLPVVDAIVPSSDRGTDEVPSGGTETILLAEDDSQVRVLTRKLLERFGYTVIEATDGKDALAQFLAHGGEIDIALLDVIMPGKNGRDVYEEMLRLEPRLKAIFTSGYSADIFQHWGMAGENFTFISKPAMPNDLLRVIRSLLDA